MVGLKVPVVDHPPTSAYVSDEPRARVAWLRHGHWPGVDRWRVSVHLSGAFSAASARHFGQLAQYPIEGFSRRESV